jgi:Resolvase, N terminal domain
MRRDWARSEECPATAWISEGWRQIAVETGAADGVSGLVAAVSRPLGGCTVAANGERRILRCAVYTRKSSEHGLEQDFNSLDAQREAAEAYIKSQAHEGWRLVKAHYDDGGLSGGTLERPALQALFADIRARKVDVVVVYKVDRLTRSLADFANGNERVYSVLLRRTQFRMR